jgi:glycosyltransferase involved in cell wall biosynthesis
MTIAICICTCDRVDSLRQLLSVVAGMEFGSLDRGEFFFVIVDNLPDGRAQAVCDRAGACLPCALHFAEEPERGISFARNRAISTALAHGAEFIAFIDDDDLPHPDWLLHLVERQRLTRADLVIGTGQMPDNLVPESLREVKFLKPRELKRVDRWGLPSWAGTSNVLISRNVVVQLGQAGPVFRPQFALTGGGDTDFFIRARIAGFSVAVAEDSVVVRNWDAGRLTWRGVLRRAFRLGSTSMHIYRTHRSSADCARKRREARREMVRHTIALPGSLLKPRKLGKRLSRIAWALGVLHAHAGRSYRYYRRDAGVSRKRDAATSGVVSDR